MTSFITFMYQTDLGTESDLWCIKFETFWNNFENFWNNFEKFGNNLDKNGNLVLKNLEKTWKMWAIAFKIEELKLIVV